MKNDNRKQILFIEDDELYREAISDYLIEKFEVLSCESAEQGMRLLTKQQPELVLLDISLPGMQGLEFLKKVKSSRPQLPVIMLTAHESVPKVVESMKLGAYDYLTKPIDADNLLFTVKRALETSDIRRELEQRRNLQLVSNKEYKLVGSSSALNKVRREIEIVGTSDSTVLIQGETGTGKELVARAIHACSTRASNPFVAINCGAIPKELMESELFGHKKGAFTGAQRDTIGKFQLADRGTLLLDEVSEMSQEAQTKLLRVLEEQEFYLVGSSDLVKVDVRVIASTNRNLRESVEKGLFREDLFFRLNTYILNIPPLRERPTDIIDLTNYFMSENNIKFDKHFKEISSEAEAALLSHPWKGNVRELRNVIERMILFEEGPVVKKGHLHFITNNSPLEKKPGNDFDLPLGGVDLEEIEKKLMLQALERTKWNKTKAAKLLNLSPPTFYYRLEKYGFAKT
jgi:DNA-binding NtrC family response regulator